MLTLLICWPGRNKMLCCELRMERVTWLGIALAFRIREWPLAVSQKNAGAHRFMTASKWILPISWMRLKMDFFSQLGFQMRLQLDCCFDSSLVTIWKSEPSCSMPRFLTHINEKITNIYCFKPLSVWWFLVQNYKTNTDFGIWNWDSAIINF